MKNSLGPLQTAEEELRTITRTHNNLERELQTEISKVQRSSEDLERFSRQIDR
jgi:hypothetical protein